jgi:site-specific DNA recombinase
VISTATPGDSWTGLQRGLGRATDRQAEAGPLGGYRVSTKYGLDQEFDSLDAQREASEAYIRSQTHDGGTLVRTRWDDGGYSGGSTEHPALQRFSGGHSGPQIRCCRLFYKVDRLTHSLADIAKLVELFDAHGVSFVSVTQQFNSTTPWAA